ncbi:urease accessory protein UreE [Acidisoma cellulosilytica]|uniref:Urease accessory protein UreE n=1 Tax=Acidisoma cellulosilyticum TaxID=2802395 RepID=A0A963Z247_9PROT|nr:urease accessory protein UreE [Acidisoma cellulosilyticum]MCB8881211.1 urease accessory protein UreE [Acidisoma cellulosilyticum]
MDQPIVIEAIMGSQTDPTLAERLHDISHHGVVEVLFVEPADLPRRRFHSHTDRGTACFVSLPRATQLFDGAVLHLENDRAIILRVGQQNWLRLRPSDDGAMELGYLAGNLHWKVRFEEGCLMVALDRPVEEYRARLVDLQSAGKVSVVE